MPTRLASPARRSPSYRMASRRPAIPVCAAACGTAPGACASLSDARPATCDPGLRGALRQSARDLGLGEIDLPSGAGHDAVYMSRICPSAMVFVPCRAGKRHTPEEWAERDAIAAGAEVIYGALRELDRTLP